MGRRLIGMLRPFVQWLSATDAFARIAPGIVPGMDQAAHRLTRGRVVLSDQMLPTLILTTTGSKSGEPRVAPVSCLPEEDGGFLLVGSNFGRPNHPAWSGNLIATPEATVSFRGRVSPVTGRLLTGDERADAWARLVGAWPVYERYTERAGDRELRVFRLSPRR
ncbi:nitroreductase family deazaflavin-dependent oxidoreductase [Streptosporangium amethystogenes]|uniref:nitroreductase family deazaflavin-dependent oxidoreductase n=1 Tax=Streptosporangium amethystogenes TaxID=2002 RepID=UPI000A511D53|nr:nitroreductase family deazaflavin-dependent oxidoreductase [Streptosporangium amethystogenes]